MVQAGLTQYPNCDLVMVNVKYITSIIYGVYTNI